MTISKSSIIKIGGGYRLPTVKVGGDDRLSAVKVGGGYRLPTVRLVPPVTLNGEDSVHLPTSSPATIPSVFACAQPTSPVARLR